MEQIMAENPPMGFNAFYDFLKQQLVKSSLPEIPENLIVVLKAGRDQLLAGPATTERILQVALRMEIEIRTLENQILNNKIDSFRLELNRSILEMQIYTKEHRNG